MDIRIRQNERGDVFLLDGERCIGTLTNLTVAIELMQVIKGETYRERVAREVLVSLMNAPYTGKEVASAVAVAMADALCDKLSEGRE